MNDDIKKVIAECYSNIDSCQSCYYYRNRALYDSGAGCEGVFFDPFSYYLQTLYDLSLCDKPIAPLSYNEINRVITKLYQYFYPNSGDK
jgi:hypothetical protein